MNYTNFVEIQEIGDDLVRYADKLADIECACEADGENASDDTEYQKFMLKIKTRAERLNELVRSL